MPRAIIIEPAARADLADASRYYESEKEGLGIRFLEEAHAFLLTLLDFPAKYPVLHRSTHCVGIPRFPYLILYRFDDDNVYVLGVMHGARDPSTMRRRSI
jgi:plasmid stabilization system protein ParE